jgi:hypothetical protein
MFPSDEPMINVFGASVSRLESMHVICDFFENEHIVQCLHEITDIQRIFPNRATVECLVKVLAVTAEGSRHPVDTSKRARLRLRKNLDSRQIPCPQPEKVTQLTPIEAVSQSPLAGRTAESQHPTCEWEFGFEAIASAKARGERWDIGSGDRI